MRQQGRQPSRQSRRQGSPQRRRPRTGSDHGRIVARHIGERKHHHPPAGAARREPAGLQQRQPGADPVDGRDRQPAGEQPVVGARQPGCIDPARQRLGQRGAAAGQEAQQRHARRQGVDELQQFAPGQQAALAGHRMVAEQDPGVRHAGFAGPRGAGAGDAQRRSTPGRERIRQAGQHGRRRLAEGQHGPVRTGPELGGRPRHHAPAVDGLERRREAPAQQFAGVLRHRQAGRRRGRFPRYRISAVRPATTGRRAV
ncbi:MAG TPA: hypothetical protein PLS34_02835, partial [Gammaproteobacteria bacterium]|nr:hypothetical protein [Gammaproteobacteria bacterium]